MRTDERALSKRHGAYALATELLQLMSMRGEYGVPHWALDPVHHWSFSTDSGYAALNLGDLSMAERCFARLLDEGDARARCDTLLNLSLVKIAQADLRPPKIITVERRRSLSAR